MPFCAQTVDANRLKIKAPTALLTARHYGRPVRSTEQTSGIQGFFRKLRIISLSIGCCTVLAAAAAENHCTSRLPFSGQVLR